MRQHREIAVLDGSPPNERPKHRPPMFGVSMTKSVEVLMTDEQFQDLKSIAEAEGKRQSELIRDAVNEYVADFRERKLFFLSRKPYTPE